MASTSSRRVSTLRLGPLCLLSGSLPLMALWISGPCVLSVSSGSFGFEPLSDIALKSAQQETDGLTGLSEEVKIFEAREMGQGPRDFRSSIPLR